MSCLEHCVGLEYTGVSFFFNKVWDQLEIPLFKTIVTKVCLESFLHSILTSAYIEQLIEQKV